MDMLGEVYHQSYGMHVVVTRAFNHTGPGRGEMYAESSWAKQIAEIEKGKRTTLEHGNLSTIRNYTDVRDVVRAYAMAIDLPPNVYNICSIHNFSMKEVLGLLINQATTYIPKYDKSSLHRPNDFSFKKPSSGEFRSIADWKPEIPLEQTLKDLLEDWRTRV
jgi:GDP-4-dehydro-6-deoxy-D-mannose reductase